MPGAIVHKFSSLGHQCILNTNSTVDHECVLGNGVHVMGGASIAGRVIIGDFSTIGTNATILPNLKIGKNVFIGANATIVCGNNIGRYAFIGAGAVVTKEVPDYALVVGNPGRKIGWMSEFGERLHFNNDNIAICKKTESKYLLKNNRVIKTVRFFRVFILNV